MERKGEGRGVGADRSKLRYFVGASQYVGLAKKSAASQGSPPALRGRQRAPCAGAE